jgi:hypothetical protein
MNKGNAKNPLSLVLIRELNNDSIKIAEIRNNLNKEDTDTVNKCIDKIVIELRSDLSNSGNKKNKLSQGNLIFYYTLNKTKNLFLIAAPKNSFEVNENTIFELIEDIEYQGILKYLDKKGELNNVGKQNLSILIEKYFSKSEENSFYSKGDDKIISVTNDIHGVKEQVKTGIKTLIHNIDQAKELDDKSIRISNNSYMLRKDADSLRKQSQWRNMRFKIILAVVAIIVITYITYKIMS